MTPKMNDIERMLADIEAETRYTQSMTGKQSLDSRVLAVMRELPRHEFVPREMQPYAYDNRALAVGYGQTISQPYIVALMSDLLHTSEDDIILEVGTGSGYQSAILSRLVKQVYTIEIVDVLADNARQKLAQLKCDNVCVRAGDGYHGWPEHAPYDGIIVTAAAPAIPQPLIAQLKPGGRLVIPLGQPYMTQSLVVVDKDLHGSIQTQTILAVAFVPLTGDHEKTDA